MMIKHPGWSLLLLEELSGALHADLRLGSAFWSSYMIDWLPPNESAC